MNDPALDQALTDGFLTTDPTRRAALYADAQKIIHKQSLLIPLRDYVNLNMASSKVTGLRFNAQGWWPWLGEVRVEK